MLGIPFKRFNVWGDAFYELSLHTKVDPFIILLDEISWMALEDPDFPGKLKIAWDKYFKKNPKLIFFICAWIKKHIVNNTGFHGRVSLKLHLRELPLNMCKKFWFPYEKNDSPFEKFRFLAVSGGIPKYLEEMNPKLTAQENIRRMAFTQGGIFFNDFVDIFTDTLMRRSENYEKIIRLLSDGAVDSKEISERIKIAKGKYLSELLDELKTAGFIAKNSSWDIKTGKISKIAQYRLIDNYLRFYIKYIEPNIEKIMAGNFTHNSLQIENLILNNRDKIKKLLNILPDEIICDNPYLQRKTKRHQGCQIDYMIQAKPDNLYICEIKYSKNVLQAYIIAEMKKKISRLSLPRHTSIRPVLIYLG